MIGEPTCESFPFNGNLHSEELSGPNLGRTTLIHAVTVAPWCHAMKVYNGLQLNRLHV